MNNPIYLSFFTVYCAQRDSAKQSNDLSKSSTNQPSKNLFDGDLSRNGPYFDKNASKNITALLGKTAYLSCRVKNLGNKTVSIGECSQLHNKI
jgi:hypothetical protein